MSENVMSADRAERAAPTDEVLFTVKASMFEEEPTAGRAVWSFYSSLLIQYVNPRKVE